MSTDDSTRLPAMGRVIDASTAFGRVEEAVNTASIMADVAARDVVQARERLSRAQAASLGAEEAAGRAIALMGDALRERESSRGNDSRSLDEIAELAERVCAEALAAREEVRELVPWVPLREDGPL